MATYERQAELMLERADRFAGKAYKFNYAAYPTSYAPAAHRKKWEELDSQAREYAEGIAWLSPLVIKAEQLVDKARAYADKTGNVRGYAKAVGARIEAAKAAFDAAYAERMSELSKEFESWVYSQQVEKHVASVAKRGAR